MSQATRLNENGIFVAGESASAGKTYRFVQDIPGEGGAHRTKADGMKDVLDNRLVSSASSERSTGKEEPLVKPV